ncbi:hypothetical protein EDD22DRAFT_855856 [Suillus occidentalis]|nr:hypothetical protein EDD22DRAFT_855856 [Suillus occidentalis]
MGIIHAGYQNILWIVFLFLSMVSCGAQGCSWERATDNRGLNRHRTACHFFKKSSILATEKRLQRVRNATSTKRLDGSDKLRTSQRDPLLERARRVGVRVHPRPFAPWKPLEKPRSSETRTLSSAPGPASSHSENEQNDVMMDSEGPTFGDEFKPDILRSCIVASASTHVY